MPAYMLVLDRRSDQIDTSFLCTHFGKLYRKNIEEMARNACVCGIALLLLLAVSASAKSNARSESWLAENAKKAGVITLKSGLQYKVLRKGDGDSHPTVDSPCECHYKCGLPFSLQCRTGRRRVVSVTSRFESASSMWLRVCRILKGDVCDHLQGNPR